MLAVVGCSSSDGGGGDPCAGVGGCYDHCVCTTGDPLACEQTCGTAGSSGSAGNGGNGGGSAGAGGSGALPACDDGSGWDPGWQAFECAVLELTNQRRAEGAACGGASYPPVGPLSPHPLLTQSARGHAKDMGDNDFFSHTNLQGQSSGDRIQATGYQGSPIGENIAAGQSSPAQVVDGWMKSSGHCKNIMNGSYQNLGVGYYQAPAAQYEHYWVQNFGG